MNLPKLLALTVLLAGARPADAQMVVQPQPKLNSTQATVRDALYRLRDRLLPVEAAVARIPRDMKTTSDASLQSRARLVEQRCTHAVATLDSVRSTVTDKALPDPDPAGVRPGLLREMEQLRGKLTQCETEFRDLGEPSRAQELRDYGIGRGRRVQASIREYEPAVQRYFRVALGIPYVPSLEGAGRTPSSP